MRGRQLCRLCFTRQTCVFEAPVAHPSTEGGNQGWLSGDGLSVWLLGRRGTMRLPTDTCTAPRTGLATRPRGGHHEYFPGLQPERRPLTVHGEPASALHDRDQLDLLGWREFERPGPSCFQGPNPDAARARQRQNVRERIAFHCHTMSQVPSTIKAPVRRAPFPVRSIWEVVETVGSTRTTEDVREVDFRLADRSTRLSGSPRFGASSWSVGSIWDKSGPPTTSCDFTLIPKS